MPVLTPAELARIRDMGTELANQKELMGDIAGMRAKEAAAAERQLEVFRELYEHSQLTAAQQAAKLTSEEAALLAAEASGRLRGEELQQAKDVLQLKKDVGTLDAVALAQLKDKLKKGREWTKELQKQQELYEQNKQDLATISSRMGSILGIGESFSGTMTGGFATMGQLMFKTLRDTENFEEMFENLGANMADKAVGAFVAASEEVMFLQDQMMSGFVKSTGATKKFTDSLYGATERIRGLGLNMDATAIAQDELFNTVTAFKGANKVARRETALFTGILVELGIDAGSAAGSMQLLTQGMGETLEQSTLTLEGIIRFGRGMDMNLNQVMADFNELAPELMKYGEGMEDVFRGLMKQSRKTGIEMKRLYDVAAKYDTFEDAATSVGRLNGILGGPYFNSIQMLYATEKDRLILLKEGFAASGRQFKDLSRFEKQSVALQAGFSSVAEAMMFFNAEAMDPAAREAAERQKALADMAREAKPVMEKLQLSVMRLAVSFKPLIESLVTAIEWFNDISQNKGPEMVSIMFIIGKGLMWLAAGAKAAFLPWIAFGIVLAGLFALINGEFPKFLHYLREAGYWLDYLLIAMTLLNLANPFTAMLSFTILIVRNWERLAHWFSTGGIFGGEWKTPESMKGPTETWGEGTIPQLQHGGFVERAGLANLHADEAVVPAAKVKAFSENITSTEILKNFVSNQPAIDPAEFQDAVAKGVAAGLANAQKGRGGVVERQPIHVSMKMGKHEVFKVVEEALHTRELNEYRFRPGT